MNERTIAAISSGLMPAAIGVIRISGSQSLEIIRQCLQKKTLTPRMMHARTLYDLDGEKLDDVLVCYFRAPHSFTGEDAVEIYAHGGAVNLARILDAVCKAGAHPAEPGEFSKRAFLNGKIDLARAEAIMDVIHAQNASQCREAQRQLSGTVSESVGALRASIMDLLCAIEASIDFSSEEELAPFPIDKIRTKTAEALDKIDQMKRAHDQYRSGGLRTVLVGHPNAGKSSLFNQLLGHERAIVTHIAGTTTDTLEAPLVLDRELFTLIDTAGLTISDNPIEAIGIERARSQVQNADIILMIIDGSRTDDGCLDDLLSLDTNPIARCLAQKTLLVVRTKNDLPDAQVDGKLAKFIQENQLLIYDISTISRAGIDALERELLRMARDFSRRFENVTLITSQRHISHLDDARKALERSTQALDNGMPAECIASDLHEAAQSLALITGEFASEDVINEIFSHFCIGK